MSCLNALYLYYNHLPVFFVLAAGLYSLIVAPTGPFIGGFECNGTETSLLACRSHSLQSSCNMLAGVTCTGTSRKIMFFETHIKLNLENGVKIACKSRSDQTTFCSFTCLII